MRHIAFSAKTYKRLEIKMVPLILAAVAITVIADFKQEPLVNEAVTGEAIYFDFTTTTTDIDEIHCYHYAVGAKRHEDICIYCFGKMHPLYDERFQLQQSLSINTYRLRIKSVHLEDAGRYVCQDKGKTEDSLSAQLVVLVSPPTCLTDVHPDGLLGPNDCNMEPDVLRMSCSASYRGNIRPIMQWREIRSSDPITRDVSCYYTRHQVTCDLAMDAGLDLSLIGSSYLCETATSETTRYNCSSGVITVIHVDANNSSTEIDFDTKKIVHCVANSSQPCSYRWKWVDGVHEEIVSYVAAFSPSKVGWHKCEAVCAIRGKQCTVLSGLVHVSEQTETPHVIIYLVLTIGVIVLVLVLSVAVITIRARRFIAQLVS